MIVLCRGYIIECTNGIREGDGFRLETSTLGILPIGPPKKGSLDIRPGFQIRLGSALRGRLGRHEEGCAACLVGHRNDYSYS